MRQFDLTDFEHQVETLLMRYTRLQADYRALRGAHEAEQARNRETLDRLNGVIERIRALEAEADNA